MGKRVTLPAINYRQYRVYPWHDKEVGEFFDVPIEKRPSIVAQFKRMKPKEWATRKMVNEKGEVIARVWRVK